MGIFGVRRIDRNHHGLKTKLATAGRQWRFDVYRFASRLGLAVGIVKVAAIAQRDAYISTRQVRDVAVVAEQGNVLTHLLQHGEGIVVVGLVVAESRLAHIHQCRRKQVARSVEDRDAALLQFGGVFRVEHQVKWIRRNRICAQGSLHLFSVVANAHGAT